MNVKLWGTRGSTSVFSPQVMRYGGDTTCVEIRSNAGDCLIIDAGSGIHGLGECMRRETPATCTICFTHTHWDHILGLPYFAPLYNPQWKISLLGPRQDQDKTFTQSLHDVFDRQHFPVSWDMLPDRPISEFATGEEFVIGSMRVKTCPTCHPCVCSAYRVEADGWVFVFTGDHECGDDPANAATERLLDFMAGADVALVDGHYFLRDYATHKGWGHSAMEQWPPLLAKRNIKHLVFTHYAPSYTDTELEKQLHALRDSHRQLPMSLQLARPGMVVNAEGGGMDGIDVDESTRVDSLLLDFFNRISQYTDTNIVLDTILDQARSLTRADAGTIYLVEDDRLVFSYTANDTLFPGSAANKYIYLKSSLPISTESIAGFVAFTGRALNIPDVRKIAATEPYTFNDSFDRTTGYRTVSMLTVPIIDVYGKVLGVLQLINSTGAAGVQSFTPTMVHVASRLVTLAVNALERAELANNLILRMLRTASLRDPLETAAHVRRVGTMAAEIYNRWAERRGIPFDEIRPFKGKLRLAAMLHDVGKVGIPDAILKKQGPLDPDERKVMETHAALGANLFGDARQDLDKLACNIALHHHQRWDGKGYTGSEEFPPLAGEDIPLEARITAVADVYDALVSPRCYKPPWEPARALAQLQKDAGTHFDPEIIDVCAEIHDTINNICARYSEQDG